MNELKLQRNSSMMRRNLLLQIATQYFDKEIKESPIHPGNTASHSGVG